MSEIVPFGERGRTVVQTSLSPDVGGLHNHSSSNGKNDVLDLQEILTLLRRKFLLVLGIAVVVLSVAAFFILRQEAKYNATAVIRLLDERRAMTGDLEGTAMEQMLGGRFNDPILSQLQLLKSRTVGGPVVDELGLRLRPENNGLKLSALRDIKIDSIAVTDTLTLTFGESEYTVNSDRGTSAHGVYGEPVSLNGIHFTIDTRPQLSEVQLELLDRERAIGWLLSNLRVTPRDRTNVVDISFVATDPRLAQTIVNTIASEYRAVNTRNAREQSRRRRIFIEEQLQQTDSALAVAQLALTHFQQREAVFSSQQKFAASQTGMMELDMRREELDASRQMLQQLLSDLRKKGQASRNLQTLVSSPDVASNPVISQLYEQLVKFEVSFDSLTTGSWGSASSNPDVERLTAMIQSTRTKLIDAVESHLTGLEARVAALDELKRRHLSEMQALPATGAEEVRLVQRVETIRKIADQLREEHQKARIAEAVEVGQMEIVDEATLPNVPISSRREIKLVGALILGLMLGAVVAFLIEQLDTSIRRKEDLEGLLRLPGLAVIPRLGTMSTMSHNRLAGFVPALKSRLTDGITEDNASNGASNGSGLVTISDLRSSGSEAYRTLRTNLIFSQSVQSIRTLVVTSAGPSEGKTTTAANLSVTFAQQGLKVLLVDCDLRKPRQHEVFEVPREPGLTQLVLGFNDQAQTIRSTPVSGLNLLPAGTLPPNPSELLGGERMREVLSELNREFDIVILDTCPLLVAADAAILGTHADGVLVVVHAGKTERGAAQQAVQQLRAVGANILGAVLNDPDAKVERYGGYYYYSKYYGVEA